jgi:hypothetical protein
MNGTTPIQAQGPVAKTRQTHQGNTNGHAQYAIRVTNIAFHIDPPLQLLK